MFGLFAVDEVLFEGELRVLEHCDNLPLPALWYLLLMQLNQLYFIGVLVVMQGS